MISERHTYKNKGIHISSFLCDLQQSFPGAVEKTSLQEKILILGDACNNATFLFDENSLSVEEYRENLIHVQQKLTGRFEETCLCHHVIKASADMIHSVIEVCDEVMAGKADDVPFNFMGMEAFVAKKANERFERLDGGEGNIIYSKNKIWKNGVAK